MGPARPLRPRPGKQRVRLPADIQDLPLLVSHQASGNDAISGWLGRDLASYNVVGTYNLLYNASIMVEAGLGSALCPDGVVSTDEHTPLTFLPPLPSPTPGHVPHLEKT